MVAKQLVAKGIQDARVIAAMQQVPRHLFVDAAMAGHAYLDKSLPIGAGQTISQPYMVARMTQMLRLCGHERVLEVGTGCGYQTAVLSCLCRRVYSIERIPALLERARANLRAAHHANVMLKCADGTLGWPEYAPFDAILAAAGGGGYRMRGRSNCAMAGPSSCRWAETGSISLSGGSSMAISSRRNVLTIAVLFLW